MSNAIGLTVDGLRRVVSAAFRRREPACPLAWMPENVRFPVGFETAAFDFDAAPHVRGFLQRFWLNPRARKANLCWATRLMKSSTMESLIAYVAAECPAPMVIMFPDRGTLDDAVETHLYPTFEQTRPVRSQLPAESLRNRRRIQFARCSLRLANAGSPASVSGFPARYVFKWEHEKTPWPASGAAENDASKRVDSRASGYSRGVKIIEEGTPVEARLSRADRLLQSPHVQRLAYHVPCPHCGEWQVLEFERLKWDRDLFGESSPAVAERSARYICRQCGDAIHNHHRPAMMRAGCWLADGEWLDADGRICGQPDVESDTMVFGPLSKLYSLLIGGWGVVAAEFVHAVDSLKNGDPSAMQKFETETLGKPYRPRSAAVDDAQIANFLAGQHIRGTAVDRAQFLVMAADVGYVGEQMIFHWMIQGWWAEERRRRDNGELFAVPQGCVVDFGVATEVEEFARLFNRRVSAGVRQLRVGDYPVGLDSSAYSNEVYAVADALGNSVYPLKGDSAKGAGNAELYRWGQRGTAEVSSKVRQFLRAMDEGDLLLVNSELSQQYRVSLVTGTLQRGFAGHVSLPVELSEQPERFAKWFRQLLSDYKDGARWKKSGPNEAGDQLRYGRVLAELFARQRGGWMSVLRAAAAPAVRPPAAQVQSVASPYAGSGFLISQR